MINFLEFKKEINKIIQKLSSNEFSFSDEKNDFINVNSIMQSTIVERDAVISLLLNMDDEEIVASISYLYNDVLNNKVFINDLFKMSAYKFVAFEIVLYTLTNLLLMDKFDLIHRIISNKYFKFEYSIVKEVSFYDSFGIGSEHICNIKNMGVASADDYVVLKLIEKRLNKDYASITDLKSCDLLLNDCSVLFEQEYIPYFIFSGETALLALTIGKRIADDDSGVFLMFGLKNKNELKDKLNNMDQATILKKVRTINSYIK